MKDRDFIDLPKLQEGQEETVLPEDMEVDEGADWASAAAFLAGVDAKQMSRCEMLAQPCSDLTRLTPLFSF